MVFCSSSLRGVCLKGERSRSPKPRKYMYYSYLLFYLSNDFLSCYNSLYQRENNIYCFYRLGKRKLLDMFVITRSSDKCYHLTYINDNKDFYVGSYQTAKKLAVAILNIYNIEKGVEC